MGKNPITSWLVVTAKDFRILFKNKFLLLIYSAIGLAVVLLALFIKFYLHPTMFRFFTVEDYLPALPNFMLYFVIFASSLYLMSQGAVSITEEMSSGTADRLKIMNVSGSTLVFGKMVFFYLASLIHVLIFNIVCTLSFYEVEGVMWMNWTIPDLLIYILAWPLLMVAAAGIFYGLITFLRRSAKRRIYA